MMLKVQELREIIKLVDNSDISEFTYEADGTTISMKKSQNNKLAVQPEPNMPVTETPSVPEVKEEPVKKQEEVPTAKPEAETTEAKQTDYDYEIVSPMVGTLYAASSPEADPYVSTGSKVETDTVVCIVEAMKLFNEIEAEVNGEIVEILAEDGELVEYGQPLFRVKKQ